MENLVLVGEWVGENMSERAAHQSIMWAHPLCSIRIAHQFDMRERKAALHESSDDTAHSLQSICVSPPARAAIVDLK